MRSVKRIVGVAGFAAMISVAAGAALMPERNVAPEGVMVAGGIIAIDGDTLHIGGLRVRLADIDAPELFSPKCDAERDLAERAKLRLAELTDGPVLLSGTDVDLYGRQLRIVMRDGESVGAMLVAEGLARNWDGARHPWC